MIVNNSRHIPVNVDNLAHGLWITLLVSAHSHYHPKSRGGVGPVRKGHRNGVLVNNFLFFFVKIALCLTH
jgi:hypothetical protein